MVINYSIQLASFPDRPIYHHKSTMNRNTVDWEIFAVIIFSSICRSDEN